MNLNIRYHRGYPVSTIGLSPTKRCIELRQRHMFANRRRPIGLIDKMIENMFSKLNNRTFTACGGWCSGNGDIYVSQIGGGWHRYCRGRVYDIRGGHVVAIRRET